MMVLSAKPPACSRAIFSLAGFEKLHSSMAQVATVSVQPHWQPMWAPTRRTSTLGFSAAVSAKARGAAIRIKTSKSGAWRPRADLEVRPTRTLFGDFRILPSYSDHFGAGVLHFDLAGNQADQNAIRPHRS